MVALFALDARSALGQSWRDGDDPIVHVLADRFGLEPEEVEKQLEAQEHADKLAKTLASQESLQLDAMWYDAGSRKLVVGSARMADRAAVVAQGASFVTLAHSRQDLVSAQQSLLAAVARALIPQVASFLDPRLHKVVVEARLVDQVAVEQAIAASAADLSLVEVRFSSKEVLPFGSFVYPGEAVRSASPFSACSLGFSVNSGTAYITAAHCGVNGTQVDAQDKFGVWRNIGSFAGSQLRAPDPEEDTSFNNQIFDSAWVSMPIWRSKAQLNPGVDDPRTIVGIVDPVVGTWVCTYGASNVGPNCGSVLAVNTILTGYIVYANWGNDAIGLIKTSACAGPGDSGGPLVRPTLHKVFPGKANAVGTLTGGDLPGGCLPNSAFITYHTPVSATLSLYGLSLDTMP